MPIDLSDIQVGDLLVLENGTRMRVTEPPHDATSIPRVWSGDMSWSKSTGRFDNSAKSKFDVNRVIKNNPDIGLVKDNAITVSKDALYLILASLCEEKDSISIKDLRTMRLTGVKGNPIEVLVQQYNKHEMNNG